MSIPLDEIGQYLRTWCPHPEQWRLAADGLAVCYTEGLTRVEIDLESRAVQEPRWVSASRGANALVRVRVQTWADVYGVATTVFEALIRLEGVAS